MDAGGIRVLVVDDSAVVRRALRDLFEGAKGFGEVTTAPDGRTALRKMARVDPDVVTLDVEMPGLDGLATLKRIMEHAPRPVIMLSAYTSEGAYKTVRALELGAVDFIQKPSGSFSESSEVVASQILEKVRALAVRRRQRSARSVPSATPTAKTVRRVTAPSRSPSSQLVVAIGASTGGTEAIRSILLALPSTFPAGLLAVQHMPQGYTLAFAARLNEMCSLEVKEATHHDLVAPGRVLIAPGNSHMHLRREHNASYVELSRAPKVNGHRPSVDVLLKSIAQAVGPLAVGVVLTGMGGDGAAGLHALHAAGGITLAQDEQSSVVYGMPKAALDAGGVQKVAHLRDIPGLLQRAVAAMGTMTPQRHKTAPAL